MEKSSSKPINIRSSFEDLDARNPSIQRWKRFEIWTHGLRDKTFWINGTMKKGKTPRLRQVTHMQRAICRNLRVFPFFVDSFIQNVLSFKPCVQISNRFHHWIPRVEIFKTRSHVDRFWRTFFHEKPDKKTGRKNWTGSMVFFPFRKRHDRDSRESTTVPLAEAKPWLSWKKKQIENAYFFPFREGTAVIFA